MSVGVQCAAYKTIMICLPRRQPQLTLHQVTAWQTASQAPGQASSLTGWLCHCIAAAHQTTLLLLPLPPSFALVGYLRLTSNWWKASHLSGGQHTQARSEANRFVTTCATARFTVSTHPIQNQTTDETYRVTPPCETRRGESTAAFATSGGIQQPHAARVRSCHATVGHRQH